MRILLLALLATQALLGQFNSYRYFRDNKFANFPNFTAPSQPEPARGECVTDPFWFDNKVCKVTDVAAQWGPLNSALFLEKIPVSRWTTENADASMFYTQLGGEIPPGSGKGSIAFYRTQGYAAAGYAKVFSYEGQEFRWSDKDPKLLYYIPLGTCQFATYNVDTGATTILRDFAADFPGCRTIRNDTEGTSSTGSRYWAWMVMGQPRFGNFPLTAVIVYDLETDIITGRLDRDKFIAQGGWAPLWDSIGYRPNAVDMAPSGDRVLLSWPAVAYPLAENFPVNAARAVSANGKLSLYSQVAPGGMYAAGDTVRLILADGSAEGQPSCSGAAAALSGAYTVESLPDAHTMLLNVSASGLGAGSYDCNYINAAIVRMTAAGGVTTIGFGARHLLRPGDTITLYSPRLPRVNGKPLKVVDVVDERTARLAGAELDDGPADVAGAYYMDARKWHYIPDTDHTLPGIRPDNAANDGSHVYKLDFSDPVRVANADPHVGWAWDLNGDPVLLQQVTQENWSAAPADSFGFTNIYTGVYTPLFFHSDFDFRPTAMHQSRVYDRNIRGWGMFKLASPLSDTHPLRGQVILVELKDYREHPEIWRVGYIHNDYGCSTLARERWAAVGNCNPDKPYDTEAQLTFSRDGLSYYWGGLWPNGNAAINTYQGFIPLRVKTKGSFHVTAVETTQAAITYIAPTAGSACTVTTSADAKFSNVVETAQHDGGGVQKRSFRIGATVPLTPGSTYYSRISCSWTPADPNAVSSEEIHGVFTTAGTAGLGEEVSRPRKQAVKQ